MVQPEETERCGSLEIPWPNNGIFAKGWITFQNSMENECYHGTISYNVPSGNVKIAIEHGHWNSEFSQKKMVDFPVRYVSLPERTLRKKKYQMFRASNGWNSRWEILMSKSAGLHLMFPWKSIDVCSIGNDGISVHKMVRIRSPKINLVTFGANV